MTAWVLPDHIADVLPSEARHIEERRRSLLDTARSYGYELVIPPLIEHLDSLLSGTGQALDLQTFKLVDQLSGRSLGLRADTTTQAARIDAHLLNRQGVARLAYCGPVVHTLPGTPRATREPLQFGCELFGHAGLEADLEVVQLAIDALANVGVQDLTLDLADAGLLRVVLAQALPAGANADTLDAVHAALAAKDQAALERIVAAHTSNNPASVQALLALPHLYGDPSVLEVAKKLPFFAGNVANSTEDGARLLNQLAQIAAQIAIRHPQVRLSIDLGDAHGYGYYTGLRFAIYAPSAGDALLRGGRYDQVGAAFGRSRPAVGFSLDIKALVLALVAPPVRSAIRAPGQGDASLHAAVARLRRSGETVVATMGDHAGELDEFNCDRELVQAAGLWVVQALDPV